MKKYLIMSLMFCFSVLIADDSKESLKKEVFFEKFERLSHLKDTPTADEYMERLKADVEAQSFKESIQQKLTALSEEKKEHLLASAKEINKILENLEEPAQPAEGKSFQLLDRTYKKTKRQLKDCIKSHQDEFVSKLVDEWVTLSLTKEEKESLEYITQYVTKESFKDALDQKWQAISQEMLLKFSLILDDLSSFKPLQAAECLYMLQMDMLQDMKNSLEQEFTPEKYQHLESAALALTKRFQSGYIFKQLTKLAEGSILPSSKIEEKVAVIMRKYKEKKEHVYEILQESKGKILSNRFSIKQKSKPSQDKANISS